MQRLHPPGNIRICLCVDGPARAGEKGTPCVLAGLPVRGQVGGCPRNCQRQAAGPTTPRVGWATEPEGSGRQDRRHRGTRPIAVSQETCRRRTNQAAGRGAPEAGDNHVCHLWRLTPHVRSGFLARRRSGAAMTIASNLGFPRIGRRRELKSALERFWSGDLDEAGLADAARALRSRHWKLQGGHRHQPRPVRRFLPLRPCAGHRLHARRDPGRLWLAGRSGLAAQLFRACPRLTRNARGTRGRHRTWPACARNDQVV